MGSYDDWVQFTIVSKPICVKGSETRYLWVKVPFTLACRTTTAPCIATRLKLPASWRWVTVIVLTDIHLAVGAAYSIIGLQSGTWLGGYPVGIVNTCVLESACTATRAHCAGCDSKMHTVNFERNDSSQSFENFPPSLSSSSRHLNSTCNNIGRQRTYDSRDW